MPEGEKTFTWMKAVAVCYGFEVVNDFIPITPGGAPPLIGRDHLDNCDIVIGDVNCFRGGEPESGTIFELGLGFAKGKKLYSFARDYRNVIHRYPVAFFNDDETQTRGGMRLLDEHGFWYAEAGTPGNLMYTVPTKMVEGNFEDCLKVLRADLIEEAKDRGSRMIPKQDLRLEPTWPVPEGAHRAYLAGFECFMLNAREVGDAMKETCVKYGFEGIFPPDEAPGCPEKEPEIMANRYSMMANIFDRDQVHIRNSNMVIANLSPFHGQEPDSGTVFEVGMTFGLGFDCYVFTGDGRPLRERVPCRADEEGQWRDVEGYIVEDYGFPLTHKIAGAAKVIVGDFDQAAAFVAKDKGINN